jgi:hypothetical protein
MHVRHSYIEIMIKYILERQVCVNIKEIIKQIQLKNKLQSNQIYPILVFHILDRDFLKILMIYLKRYYKDLQIN